MRYATRRSMLALAQSRAFVRALSEKNPGLAFDEVQIVTTGDRIQDRPLSEVGGKGLFVKEIEEALLDGRADLAVHSIKDVPGTLPDGLVIECVPKREDPRDVLVSPRYGSLAALPEGAKVGTSSLRRSVLLHAARPDLAIVPLRGNVDTRLKKVDAGDCDAIVLARAGLVRLGLEARATEILSIDVSLPAVGQGALGIECREGDATTLDVLAKVHDPETMMAVAAERGVMIALGGDCKTPLGAHAERDPDGIRMRLRAFIADVDGTRFRSREVTSDWPSSKDEAVRLGLDLGHSLR
ncbi:MAG: hydroxymethylbilane synthase [Polyangiaceae bacterium]